MVSKFRREDHALFQVRAHAILPQVPRRVGHKISLQGFAGPYAGPHPRDDHANMQRTGRTHRERCVGKGPCPHVLVDTAETVAVGCHAAHQGPVFATYPDGVSRVTQALLGQTVLGTWILLDHFWKCDR